MLSGFDPEHFKKATAMLSRIREVEPVRLQAGMGIWLLGMKPRVRQSLGVEWVESNEEWAQEIRGNKAGSWIMVEPANREWVSRRLAHRNVLRTTRVA